MNNIWACLEHDFQRQADWYASIVQFILALSLIPCVATLESIQAAVTTLTSCHWSGLYLQLSRSLIRAAENRQLQVRHSKLSAGLFSHEIYWANICSFNYVGCVIVSVSVKPNSFTSRESQSAHKHCTSSLQASWMRSLYISCHTAHSYKASCPCGVSRDGAIGRDAD